MYLIQLFLPLYDNDKHPIEHNAFDWVFDELVQQFGGVTAFQRSPAEGAWRANGGRVSYDEVIIYEVMACAIDRAWWTQYRQELEGRFRQEKLLLRAVEVMEL